MEVQLKIKNYKCFGESAQGYESILPMNIIVGRNNSGKSSLLDLIAQALSPQDISHLGHNKQTSAITYRTVLGNDLAKLIFPENTTGGHLDGDHWRTVGCHLVSTGIFLEKVNKNQPTVRDIDVVFPAIVNSNPAGREYIVNKIKSLVNHVTGFPNPFQDKIFKRLSPDRDIVPEIDPGNFDVESNGLNATTIIHHFLSKSHLPSEMVEILLMREMNRIFFPDSTFGHIVVQQHGDQKWEIYLHESGKGRIPLSQTGHGVKTVLLVLIFLYLVPYLENKDLKNYWFGFEELENNLHPALQRRLLLYLRQIAKEKGCKFFITTHSNVVIDLFADDPDSQILHVTHNGMSAQVNRAKTYIDNRGILDDLDVRASDLLQANGIVWVEGPSDRLYFNRWMSIISGGEISEGAQYQCVFYGGRLLSHLSAEEPDVPTDEVVEILRVNRNAILLMDSDKKQETAPINATKQRMVDEIKNMSGLAWVTAGREIENYLPFEALQAIYPKIVLPAFERYASLEDYLNVIAEGEGKKFVRGKPMYAEKFIPHLTLENMANVFDLKEKATLAYEQIKKWNGMP